MKYSFSGCRIPGGQFFEGGHFKYLFPLLYGFQSINWFLLRYQLIILLKISTYDELFFSCLFQNFLSVFDHLIIMCPNVGLQVYPFWSLLRFLDFNFMSFLKFGKFQLLFLQILSALFSLLWDSHMHILLCWMASHKSLRLCSLFCSFFFLIDQWTNGQKVIPYSQASNVSGVALFCSAPSSSLTTFQRQKWERLAGGRAGRFLRLPFLLIYPVNFHCYSFIVIKFMGEKDGIILRHN